MNSRNDILQRKKNIFADDEHKFVVHEHIFKGDKYKFTGHEYKMDIVYGKFRFTGTSR